MRFAAAVSLAWSWRGGGAPARWLRRILHSFIVEAVHRGEYDPSLNAHRATALLYSQFEAVILRLTLSGRAELSESVDTVNSILFSFRAPAAGVPRLL